MFTVELYAEIGRAVMVEGLSRREAANGVHRNTITHGQNGTSVHLLARHCSKVPFFVCFVSDPGDRSNGTGPISARNPAQGYSQLWQSSLADDE
jgi:hypothetical protein